MKAFLDTNVLVYAYSQDERAPRARALLKSGGLVAIQSLSEFSAVALGKMKMPWADLKLALALIEKLCMIAEPLDLQAHSRGLDLAERHRLPIFDAMLIAVAMANECRVFYSEDLQDGRTLEDRLTIRNPFA